MSYQEFENLMRMATAAGRTLKIDRVALANTRPGTWDRVSAALHVDVGDDVDDDGNPLTEGAGMARRAMAGLSDAERELAFQSVAERAQEKISAGGLEDGPVLNEGELRSQREKIEAAGKSKSVAAMIELLADWIVTAIRSRKLQAHTGVLTADADLMARKLAYGDGTIEQAVAERADQEAGQRVALSSGPTKPFPLYT